MNELYLRSLLSGMVVVVTGGANGIGSNIARTLALSGACVIVSDVDVTAGPRVVLDIVNDGGRADFLQGDIGSVQGCEALIDFVAEKFGKLDALVNCAAPRRERESLHSLKLETWERHQATVVCSMVSLASLSSDLLKKSPYPSIVSISSAVARQVAVDHCSLEYHVSKAALEHATRYLAVELGEFGIRVNAIAPGLVDREHGSKVTDNPSCRDVIDRVVPLKRAGKSEDISGVVMFLISPLSSYVTGQVIIADGGLGLSEPFSVAMRVAS